MFLINKSFVSMKLFIGLSLYNRSGNQSMTGISECKFNDFKSYISNVEDLLSVCMYLCKFIDVKVGLSDDNVMFVHN